MGKVICLASEYLSVFYALRSILLRPLKGTHCSNKPTVIRKCKLRQHSMNKEKLSSITEDHKGYQLWKRLDFYAHVFLHPFIVCLT